MTPSGVGAGAFEELRTDPELSAERETVAEHLARAPDKVLSFVSEMPILYGDGESEASSYVCPMHPEVTAGEPGTCPKCGMKLVPVRSGRRGRAAEAGARVTAPTTTGPTASSGRT